MKIQHTPAPYPSTILSLTPAEQFRYRSTTIQAITISPLPADAQAPYTLSGESALFHRLQTYTVQVLPPGIPALTRSVAEAELSRYATPVPRAAQHPDAEAVRTQRLAAPGPAPTTSQAHAIRANAHLTPAPPARPAPAPGKHRA
jgi:hypothetical protein